MVADSASQFLSSAAAAATATTRRPSKACNDRDGTIGYDAGAGWNACTGLGVADGQAMAKVFQQAAAEQGAPVA